MDIFSQIAVKIIQGQESIIGPVAIEQASQIAGLEVDWDNKKVSITGDAQKTLNNLVSAYQKLFGQISVEVSKEAVAGLIHQMPPEDIPEALK
jgi:hypothetical protein